MAFHSYEFIFGMLPIAFLGFAFAHRVAGWTAAFQFVAAASLAFYAQFSMSLVLVLLVSVVGNFVAGEQITRFNSSRRVAGSLLIAAIGLNITALGYFKYTNFIVDVANAAFGSEFSHAKLLLPVGISFFTFIQIGYLIECYNGQVERPGFARYVVFATFFPCVTAGPLVLQREFFAQMQDRRDSALDARRISVGLTMFVIGLFKKVVLADSIATHATPVFDGVAGGMTIDAITAWVGAVSYTLQLYFDFSGYSDMALGLGCLFGLKLPLNFNSPLQQTSISEFWRCWHMSMTRFFTTYIYTPLAIRGMRAALTSGSGRLSRLVATGMVPAIVTFFVAGIWHGAGWTFVVYGLLHGVAIAINLAWREFSPVRMPNVLGWSLTMAVVVSGLVIFRADDLLTAKVMLSAMWLGGRFGAMAVGSGIVVVDLQMAAALILLLGSIVLLMPNSQTIMARDWVSSDPKPAEVERAAGLLVWRPAGLSSVCVAGIAIAAIASVGATSTFLYYQF